MNTPAASPPERSEQDLITALQATVSASRLSLFLHCQLKFYFRYVLKYKFHETALFIVTKVNDKRSASLILFEDEEHEAQFHG